ncbi:MAG: hypothetical protein ACRCZI_05310 [Cetobacterium sp.]
MCIGNKCKMDNLVKIVTVFDVDERMVKKYIVDVDQTGPSTEDCAKAIAHAMKKLGCCGEDTDRFKLRGSTTDSGGGGVLENLGALLIAYKFAADNLLVAACTIHCMQLQLSNPILQLIGVGELGSKNLLQFLFKVFDVQESMTKEEWWEYVAVGVESAKIELEKGPSRGTYPTLKQLYKADCEKRALKKLKPLDQSKFNDKYHFA